MPSFLHSTISITGFSINIVMLVTLCLAISINIFVLRQLFHQYKWRNLRLMILYSANTYFMLLGYSIALLWTSIGALLGDLNIETWDNSDLHFLCRFRSYLCFMFVVGVYSSFSIQTAARLFRIVYARFTWFLTQKFYFFIVFIQWLFISLIAIFFFERSVYHPLDHFCLGTLSDHALVIYSISVTYLLPMSSILFMYWRIIEHTKRSPRTLTIVTTRRDIVVVRRIILFITGLLFLSLPSCILWLLDIVHGETHPLTYRIGLMSNSVAETLLSILAIYISPSKHIFLRTRK